MKQIDIILGSVRDNALGHNLLRHIELISPAFEENSDVTFKFMDLRDYHLTFFDEVLAPLDNPDRKVADNVQRYLDDLATADGYLFITPEYNHAISGALKNALDYIADEGEHKATKVIGYSDSMRGGQFGAADLMPILQKLGFFVLPTPTLFAHIERQIDTDGKIIEDAKNVDRMVTKLDNALKEIIFYTDLLSDNPFDAD